MLDNAYAKKNNLASWSRKYSFLEVKIENQIRKFVYQDLAASHQVKSCFKICASVYSLIPTTPLLEKSTLKSPSPGPKML